MYAYCVREKTKLFQCISKSKNASVFRSEASMNDCKLIPSVLGFASAKLGTLSYRQMDFYVPCSKLF